MGYTTTFDGTLKIESELSAKEAKLILKMEDIYTGNHFDFELNDDWTGIIHDGMEKTYEAVEQINFLIDQVKMINPKFALSGFLDCQGEDRNDRWRLKIVNNKAIREDVISNDGKTKCPECGHCFML